MREYMPHGMHGVVAVLVAWFTKPDNKLVFLDKYNWRNQLFYWKTLDIKMRGYTWNALKYGINVSIIRTRINPPNSDSFSIR